MSYNLGSRTFTASGDLPAHARVKPVAGSTTSPVQVELAGAGEEHIGTTEYSIADGAEGTIRLRNSSGTVEMIAAEAFAVGADLYGGASGKVQDTVSGSILAVALEVALADGDVVEVYNY